MNIQSTLNQSSLILTECAISERIRRCPDIELHPTLFITPLIYDEQGSNKIEEIFSQYRNIATNAAIPILLCAPTWRIDKTRLTEAGFDEALLYDAIHFMQNLQNKWQNRQSPLFLGGLLAPKNDCYSPDQALTAEEAEEFHSWQIERLAQGGVDCIVAQTIPAVSEGLGIAKAISTMDVPYIISFVINQKGEVLDTTRLLDAITLIDNKVMNPPIAYMVNCVYPTFICAENQPASLFNRLLGIQANSSSFNHSKLDGSTILHQDNLNHWGEKMLWLNKEFGLKILGGCCGTDDTYLQYIADNKSG